MKLEDMTFDKLITPKTIYVVNSMGQTYDTEEQAQAMVAKSVNVGYYYKFYEVFYAPSYEQRSKRYTKFMMIMTRRTVAIHSEVTSYLTNVLGLEPIVFISDEWGWRDNWMITETDYKTCDQVYEAIQRCMKVHGGNEPGGNPLIPNGVGTLHLINFDGELIYCDTPTSAADMFDKFVNYDPDKPQPKPVDPDLDKEYI